MFAEPESYLVVGIHPDVVGGVLVGCCSFLLGCWMGCCWVCCWDAVGLLLGCCWKALGILLGWLLRCDRDVIWLVGAVVVGMFLGCCLGFAVVLYDGCGSVVGLLWCGGVVGMLWGCFGVCCWVFLLLLLCWCF